MQTDNDVQIECVTATESEPSISFSSDCSEPRRKKKKKKSALIELIGNKFQSENDHTTDSETFKDIVQSTCTFRTTLLQSELSISVDHPPLHWWSIHRLRNF